MAVIEMRFTRKNWEKVMIVKDGDSMLVFLDNGREQGHHDLQFPSIQVCDEEWDNALLILASKGFKEDAPKDHQADSLYNF